MKKKLVYTFLGLLGFTIIFLIYFAIAVLMSPPKPKDETALNLKLTKLNDSLFTCENSWLKKSETGLWELYIEGEAFRRGAINGKLTQNLAEKQEDYFIAQLRSMIPSSGYINFLKYFVAWFNRDLDTYITEEQKLEIYGVSSFASEKYSYIGPKYQRMLNYHAAHDIGHFLQEKNLVVGCTSFSAWGDKSEDSSLIVGRNFDFYAGDKFAENKIVSFTNPDQGYKFVTITWGGMIGAVSGMNEKGLCITINAAKSDLPTHTATPIALVAREILQYAKNISEAYSIAKKRKTFVAQSIMIGSAEDNKTAIIEKSPYKIGLFNSDTNYIICANHFQSEELKNDPLNQEHILESTSMFRYRRMAELIGKYPRINANNAAAILRNRQGLNDKNIGLGNEKTLNHLLAHHSVIFKPSQKIFWISTSPFQIGKYVAYDLNKIFNTYPGLNKNIEVTEAQLAIAPDTFLYSEDFKKFKQFKLMQQKIKSLKKDDTFSEANAKEFISTNPEFYQVYAGLGDYYKLKNQKEAAAKYYGIALRKEIPWKNDEEKIKNNLAEVREHR